MIEIYKVNILTEQTGGSNLSTRYFMTLEKATEYLEEQRQYYFDDSDESDSESDTDGDDLEDSKEELKENNGDSDDESDDSYVEEITVEFLTSLFEETQTFIPCIVFEYFSDDEYTSATINKIKIDN
jgi:hypothetical protein